MSWCRASSAVAEWCKGFGVWMLCSIRAVAGAVVLGADLRLLRASVSQANRQIVVMQQKEVR